jgi:O-antigen/teichoic acid export membrane protein
MGAQRINRVCGSVLIILSFTALLTVLTGYAQAPQPDEGAGAHIFQLAIVAVVLPTLLLFFVTADWRQRWRSARPLAVSGAALVLAFAALYYLEHYWWR